MSRKLFDKAAMLIPLMSILIAGSYLGYRYWDYRTAELEYDRIAGYIEDQQNLRTIPNSQQGYATEFQSEDRPEDSEEAAVNTDTVDETVSVPSVDWEELLTISKDIKAWINIPGLDISYPVVQGKDNDQYLHHMPNGEYKYAGSIFMDYKNSPDFMDLNTIIYGHNMDSGAMFGKFRTFGQEIYEKDPIVWICVPGKAMQYRVFSYHISIVGDESYTLFPEEYSLYPLKADKWIKSEADRSDITSPLPDRYEKRVVTLSTCATRSNQRRVIQAVLVKEYKTGT